MEGRVEDEGACPRGGQVLLAGGPGRKGRKRIVRLAVRPRCPTSAGWQSRASTLRAPTRWDPKYPGLGHHTNDAGVPGKFRVQSITIVVCKPFDSHYNPLEQAGPDTLSSCDLLGSGPPRPRPPLG